MRRAVHDRRRAIMWLKPAMVASALCAAAPGPLPCAGHLPFLHAEAWRNTPSSPERLFHARSTNHRFPEAHCRANIRDGKNLGST
jgi:hypothetical protein